MVPVGRHERCARVEAQPALLPGHKGVVRESGEGRKGATWCVCWYRVVRRGGQAGYIACSSGQRGGWRWTGPRQRGDGQGHVPIHVSIVPATCPSRPPHLASSLASGMTMVCAHVPVHMPQPQKLHRQGMSPAGGLTPASSPAPAQMYTCTCKGGRHHTQVRATAAAAV